MKEILLAIVALLPGTDGLVKSIAPPLAIHQAPKPVQIEVPVKSVETDPGLSSPRVLALDRQSGVTLYSKNESTAQPIASLTKLVTALVIVSNHKLSEVVEVPALPSYRPEEVHAGLKPGQKLTVGELLSALMIPSYNDAADALAIIDSGSVEAFVKKMNQTVTEWGIKDVQLYDASGLSQRNNTASARAIAQIAELALHNPEIAKLAATPTAAIDSADGQIFRLTSTDPLLLQDNRFRGIKTGYTPAAGQCFVSLVNIGGHEVITVVLGSQDRFGETVKLANWIESTYRWQKPL